MYGHIHNVESFASAEFKAVLRKAVMYTCAKQAVQALQESASPFWKYSCKNLLKVQEGECYLPGVCECFFYIHSMLDPQGLIFCVRFLVTCLAKSDVDFNLKWAACWKMKCFWKLNCSHLYENASGSSFLSPPKIHSFYSTSIIHVHVSGRHKAQKCTYFIKVFVKQTRIATAWMIVMPD